MARPGGSGPPISFKTVPGRHRTQKWNVAKTYNYDGDDWGGYDAYGDYGYDDSSAPQQQQQQPAILEQQLQPDLPSQLPSQQQPQQRPARQMSFDQDFTDERTQFTSRAPQPPQPPQLTTGPYPPISTSSQNSRGVSPAKSAASSSAGGGKRSGEYPPFAPSSSGLPGGRPRDFTNPEQVPPPLNTQSPRAGGASPALSAVSLPAPGSNNYNYNNNNNNGASSGGGVGAAYFPPRQSSMSNSPVSEPAPSALTAEKEKEKALPTPPFIRPSDIYKRMAAERERERRESESSSRASMESSSAREGESPAGGSARRPLSAVEEGAQERGVSGVPEGFGEPRNDGNSNNDRGVGGLPAVEGVSSFGSDWFGAGGQQQQSTSTSTSSAAVVDNAASPTSLQTTPVATRAPASFAAPAAAAASSTPAQAAPAPAPAEPPTPPQPNSQPPSDLAHQPSQGYRSVVNRAFDHSARSGSDPATPISRDNSHSTTTTATASEGVSRSNTDSTSNISPIMSRVPSAGTAAARQQMLLQQQQQQGRETIDEEPRGTGAGVVDQGSSTSSSVGRDVGITTAAAAVGAAAVGGVVAAGYRRSYDPPSNGTSPARAPEIGSGEDGGRRLSEGLAAETVTPTDTEDTDGRLEVTTGVDSATVSERSEAAVPRVTTGVDSATVPERSSPAMPQVTTGVDSATVPMRSSPTPDTSRAIDTTTAAAAATVPTPTLGRARAGTDYSMRESDIADAVNQVPSPEQPNAPTMSPIEAAHAEKAEQNLFLRTHTNNSNTGLGTPTSQIAPPDSPFGLPSPVARAATPGSGRASPARSRVREMASKFQEIHDASRRNSQISLVSTKSSWSRFGADEKDRAPVKRQGTMESGFGGSESEYDAEEQQREREGSFGGEAGGVGAAARPELGGREQSFRPNLPGGWVSYRDEPGSISASPAPRAAQEEYSPVVAPPDTPVDDEGAGGVAASARDIAGAAAGQDLTTPRASYEAPSSATEAVDLTPTTQRTIPPQGSSDPPSHFDQAKTAGAALGASLLATVGLGHQTTDFGSARPAAPVDQPEMQPRAPIGELGYAQRPELATRDTDATGVTDIGSVASVSVPPTPPAKDTPPLSSGPATVTQEKSSALGLPGPGQGQAGYYFSGAPLRTGRSREGSPDPARGVPTPPPAAAAAPVALPLGAGFVSQKPGMSPSLSMHPRSTDLESDRLRKEIVRSLEASSSSSAPQREREVEDAERTQDALDAPENARRVAEGGRALPPAEVRGDVAVPSSSSAAAAMTTPRPPQQPQPQGPSPRLMLDQRFSFEQDAGEVFGGAFGAAPAAAATAGAGAAAVGLGLGVEGADKDLPPPPPTVMEPPLEHSPEIKPEMPYERPRSRGLHIMNADEGGEGDDDGGREEVVSRGLSVATSSVAPPVSPITKSQENLHLRHVVDATRDGDEGLAPPSPVSEGRGSPGGAEGPQVYRNDDEEAVSRDAADAGTPTTPTTKQKIPPFREILAIKSSADRIRTYDDTRRTFADTNTGLADWLSGMLAQHPEHASLSTPHGGYNYGTSPAAAGVTPAEQLASLKHRQSPSLAKFTRNFSSSAGGGGGGGGSPTATTTTVDGGGLADSPGAKTPSKEIDMEKLQQRGKDLMKNASVLGGRAQAGAKGLLAKGKSRFGSTREKGSKDPSPSVSQSASSSTLVSTGARGVDGPTTTDPTILQPTPLPASNLSRSNSRASSFFRPSRSRNQTPSSISSGAAGGVTAAATAGGLGGASGPLSRTLSRLRDRSRSQSGSRSHSRRSSRPRSLILGNAELLSIQGTSPRADERGGGMALAGSPLISPWIEPPDDDDAAAAALEEFRPDRLGVLPSPTGGSFSSDLPIDGLGGEGGGRGAGESEGEGEGEGEGLSLPALSTMPEDLGDAGKVEEDELYESTPVIENARPDYGNANGDEMYDTTPKALRRGDKEEKDDDNDTPKAGQSEWRAGLVTAVNPGNGVGVSGRDEVSPAVDENREVPAPQPDTQVHDENAGPQEEPLQPPQLTVLHVPPTVVSEGGSDGSILSGADEQGRKSDVSEEVHAGDNDGIATIIADRPTSTRSSVSSVEGQNRVLARGREIEQDQPVMSFQAGPAGPVSSDPPISRDGVSSAGTTRAGQDFANRTLQPSRPDILRQLSFEQLQQDTDGGIKQDVLETPRDLQANIDPDDDDRPFEANFTSLTRHRKPSGTQSTDRRSKRLSGFLAGQPSLSNPVPSNAPPASMISDEYGLEGVQDLHDTPDVIMREEETSQKDEREGKRKSGVWETFRKTSNTSDADFSRQPSMTQPFNPLVNENFRSIPPQGPSNVRAEPQRASTIATEPAEKKKNRFSGLGSLFGRSSTTGHKPEKTKKLSKTQQSESVRNSQRLTPQQRQQPPQPPPGGRIGGTDVFMVSQRPGPHAAWSDPYMRDGRPPVTVPPGGWYAPTDERPTFPGPPRPAPPPQNFSHPSGFDARGGVDPRIGPDPRVGVDPRGGAVPRPGMDPRSGIDPQAMGMDARGIVMDPRRGIQFSNVPESFRPVDASYNRPGMPMRPSDFPRPAMMPSQSFNSSLSTSAGSRMSYPQPQPPGAQQLAPDSMRQRQPSNASTEYSLSPQISGQSEWQRSGWQHRSSLPGISPIDSKPGFPGPPLGRDARVEPISEEVARSPAREYKDQQTPYNLALPPSNGQAHSTRTSYWARQRRSQQPEGYRSVALQGRGYGMPPGANAYEYGVQTPPSRSNAASPMGLDYPPGPAIMTSYPPSSSFDGTRGDSYLSPPTSQTRVSREEDAASSRLSPLLSQEVDKSGPEEPGGLPSTQKDESDNPYLSVQLPNLGNTTKDAPSDEDDVLVFRGASYPGQEWIPAEWE